MHMQMADRSLAPFFIHRRMWPKWVVACATGAGMALLATPLDLALVPAGFAAFLAIEYALHRWILHAGHDTWRARHLTQFHANHHRRPRDLSVLFLPGATAALAPFLLAALWPVLGLGGALSLLGGLLLGMAYYEYVLFTAHRVHATLHTPWMRWLRARHMLHHHRSERHWFGVSLPLLDDALGTGGAARDVPATGTARDILDAN